MRKIKILILLFVVFISNISNINAQSKAVFLTDSTSWADSVLLTLSEEERIAQLFVVTAYSNQGDAHKQQITDLIEHYKVGGLMFLQGGPVKASKTHQLLSVNNPQLL